MDIWPLRLGFPDCLSLEQLAVLSPPPSAGGNPSVSGYVYTSALSEDASLHQQGHAKKVCLAASYRKTSCTANFPQYLSIRIDPRSCQLNPLIIFTWTTQPWHRVCQGSYLYPVRPESSSHRIECGRDWR